MNCYVGKHCSGGMRAAGTILVMSLTVATGVPNSFFCPLANDKPPFLPVFQASCIEQFDGNCQFDRGARPFCKRVLVDLSLTSVPYPDRMAISRPD